MSIPEEVQDWTEFYDIVRARPPVMVEHAKEHQDLLGPLAVTIAHVTMTEYEKGFVGTPITHHPDLMEHFARELHPFTGKIQVRLEKKGENEEFMMLIGIYTPAPRKSDDSPLESDGEAH